MILWVWSHGPLESMKLTFVDAISVGATLSATDPVTILAIFNTYKVDPHLYTVIFGESILNDAVAIVLFETAQRYKPQPYKDDEGETHQGSLTPLKLLESFGVFLLVFFGSLVIGLAVGIGTSLFLKLTHIRRSPKIESCIILLIAYASYFFANAVHLSGMWTNRIRSNSLVDDYRYCVSAFLRHLSETLRLPQHVSADPAHHKVYLPSIGTAVGKFHIHLPRIVALY